ncbi:MAG: 30S ribosomal protein S6 [Patescibacteria group bacterium]
MREYELTYLVSDDVPEIELKKVTDKVAGMITSDGGKVTKEESWGRRKLAYPIGKQTFATYITVWFETEADKIAPLDHELRVYPQVIRHLATLKVQKSEEIKVTKEDIVDTSEVEGVIGEKSFEVVEGETEASKDLMAVRETSEDDTEDKADQAEEIIDETVKEDKLEVKTEDVIAQDKPKRTRKTKIVAEEEIKEPVSEPKIDLPASAEAQLMQAGAKVKKTKKPAVEKQPEEPKEEEAERIKKLDEKLDELLKDDL